MDKSMVSASHDLLISPDLVNNPIITDEVPEHIFQQLFEQEKLSSFYHAVLKKRLGHITAYDFMKYAHRFFCILNEVYRGSKVCIQRNARIPIGFYECALASSGAWEYEGEDLEINRLDASSFREIFRNASTVRIDIRPQVNRDEIRHAFSVIQWTNRRPGTIFFYSQGGGGYTWEIPFSWGSVKNTMAPAHVLL